MPHTNILTRAFACLLFPLLTSGLYAQISRTYEKVFPVPESRTLSIDTFHGPIRIVQSDAESITLTVVQTVSSTDETAADDRLEHLHLEAAKDTRQLNFTARYERSVRWAWEEWPPVKIATEVQVPVRCKLILRARDGAITVLRARNNTLDLPVIEADLQLFLSKGDAFVGEIRGNLSVETTQGDITVTACSGDLNLRTRSGSILVGRTGRSALISATDGDVEVQRALGPLTVRGDRAPVMVSFPSPLRGDATLSTNGEELTVLLDPSAPCTVNAQAGTFGQVQLAPELRLTITSGAPNTRRLLAQQLSGGPLLNLKASGGHVRLKALPVLPLQLAADEK